MTQLIKTEIYKIWKGKTYLICFMLLALITVVTFVIILNFEPVEVDIMMLFYLNYAVNYDVVYPLLAAIFFAPLMTNEYRDGTFKLLLGSPYSRSQIYVSKFLGGSLVFGLSFIALMLLSFIIISVLLDLPAIYIEYTRLSIWEAFFRVAVITTMVVIYFMSLASLILFLSVLTKGLALTVFVIFILLIIYTIFPIPSGYHEYLLFGSRSLYSALAVVELPWLQLIKHMLVCGVYMYVFLIAGFLIFRKQNLS